MKSKKPYRSKMRILVDMMRTILEEGESGAGPTKILYAANLSHDRLTQYIQELLEKQMIAETQLEDSSRAYRLTEKGEAFLKEFARVERFSEAFGIEI